MNRKRATTTTDSRAARYRRRLSSTLQWDDIDQVAALSTADATSPVALLSLPLLREGVFAFLVPSLDKPETFVNDLNLPQHQAMLTPVRLVTVHAPPLAVDCAVASDGEPQSERVKQLQFVATKWRWSMPPAKLLHMDWNSFFARFPNIVRLDISVIDDETVKLMLPASSQECPQVKDLVLNTVFTRFLWRHDGYDDYIAALSEALQAWYTSNGGLHALTIPLWVQRQEACAPFLISVADYCPHMICLRGLAPPGIEGGSRRGYQPTVSADDWSIFCRRCPEIKAHTGTPGLFYSA